MLVKLLKVTETPYCVPACLSCAPEMSHSKLLKIKEHPHDVSPMYQVFPRCLTRIQRSLRVLVLSKSLTIGSSYKFKTISDDGSTYNMERRAIDRR